MSAVQMVPKWDAADEKWTSLVCYLAVQKIYSFWFKDACTEQGGNEGAEKIIFNVVRSYGENVGPAVLLIV